MENSSSRGVRMKDVKENMRRHLVALLADGACDTWAHTSHKSGDDDDFETIAFSIKPYAETGVEHIASFYSLMYGLDKLLRSGDVPSSEYAKSLSLLLYSGASVSVTAAHVSAMVQGATYGTIRYPSVPPRSS